VLSEGLMVADKGWGENHQFPALNHHVIEVTLAT